VQKGYSRGVYCEQAERGVHRSAQGESAMQHRPANNQDSSQGQALQAHPVLFAGKSDHSH